MVYPEITSSNTNTSTYSVPLGLGSIATYCREKIGDSLEVRILDGSVMSHAEQMAETERFMPDVVGLSPTIASQGNAYKIARRAKDLGSLVIFGGVNSTNLWQPMLRNRDFIDGIVLYDGEMAMHEILERASAGNVSLEGIQNVACRGRDGSAIPPERIRVHQLCDLPDIDYSLFDLERFFRQTESRGFGRAITYYAGKGCSKRKHVNLSDSYSFAEYSSLVNSMNRCGFCGRNDLGLRNMPEDREVRIVRSLHEKYGVTGFFNVQDTVNLSYASPIGLDGCWFRLFIGMENVTPKNIRLLKQRYGKNIILQVGVESASPDIRRAYGKSAYGAEDVFSMADLCLEEGVRLHASFILGGMGETGESMCETAEVIEKLAKYRNVDWLLVSPLIGLPGSQYVNNLLENEEMQKKYKNKDMSPIHRISRDVLSVLAPAITREDIIKLIREMYARIRKNGRTDLVLDVKGVTPEEEIIISPQRGYCMGK